MLTRARLPLHRHLPDEQPRRRQRHPARRRASTTSLGPPGGPGSTRPCSATPTRASTPDCHRARRPSPCQLRGRATGLRVVRARSDREHTAWIEWLRELGYDVSSRAEGALSSEPERPEELGVSAFTDEWLLEWLQGQDRPWFAHLSYLRPHPPYAAAGRFAHAVDPDDVELPIQPSPVRHWLHEEALGMKEVPAPADEADAMSEAPGPVLRHGRRGRRPAWPGLRGPRAPRPMGRHCCRCHLRPRRAARRPRVIGKARLLRGELPHPGIVRAPGLAQGHGSVVDAFTENVDLFPTICEAIGLEIPVAVRRLAAHRLVGGSATFMVAFGRELGVRLEVPEPSPGRLRLAMGQTPRAPEPRRQKVRGHRLRAVRGWLVAVL